MSEYNRISGRVGNIVNLDVTFYHNGVPTDPFAIRRVDIYRTAVKDENLELSIVIPLPDDPQYPYPILRIAEGSGGSFQPGRYILPFLIPNEFVVPDIYFDVWRFIGAPGEVSLGGDEDESGWVSQCNRFWAYPDNWYVDDELVTLRVGFEALDKHFKKPEVRTMEVGLMPLPLYDFDYNRIIPLIPMLQPYIHIETMNGEVLVENDLARIGLRQGSYRSNPFVIQYRIDTTKFLIGTYKYRITLALPNGESRVSDDMSMDVS